ncbi:hypothetical protein [Deinococcus sp.]|uniref:hypothetical protein n=1 Tax=Deinococcus sp. TaxID=47478 RepID=UPI0025C5A114|nr:hypothetical protein [Deinococcus sp.]
MIEMTEGQVESVRVTDVRAARALRQDTGLLGLFLRPVSPSEVAGRVGMAANLVHHHARRLAGLGLLRELGREGGRVRFVLAAREFRVPSDLLPPEDEQGNGTADLRELSEGFERAYGRSWALAGAGEEDVYIFGKVGGSTPGLPRADAPAAEGHPAHLDRVTVNLTPERYVQLARELSEVLARAYAQGHSEGGQPCTLAVLAYRADDDGIRSLSRSPNSFLGSALPV